MRKILAILFLMAFVPGCPPTPSGQKRADEKPGSKTRYSVEAMTDAVFDIEESIGTEGHEPLLSRYEKEFRADPRHPFKRFLWAFAIEDRNQAWTELTKITKLNDKFYWAYLGMAIILDSWKVDDQSSKNFEKVIQLGPRIAIGYGRFGRMLMRKGDLEKSLEMLRKAVELDPKRKAYRLDLARALTKAGEKEKAERHYLKVISEHPEDLEANWELARLLDSSGQPEKAIEYFDKAAEVAPGNYDVNLQRAECLKKLKRLQDAMKAFTAACDLKEEILDCWRTKAALAEELGDRKERIAAFERILRVKPDDMQANRFLAPIYLAAGDIEKALPAFKVVREKEPDNLEVLAGLATIYEKGGEFSKAIELAEKILSVNPDHEAAKEIRDRLFSRFHVLEEHISGKSPDQVFSRNRSQIAKVYKERLKKKPGLRGEMRIKVTVDDDGKVTSAVIDKNTLGDLVVDISAIWNIRRSVFPAGFGATYDFALTLKPGE